ncbi:MAG: hypothetical protein BWY52_02400 [Chloroflexi bacterium ADurb.Bin325]|nr:MAG: hypothetical protein BWY52_02400 [Chloroflexi bacterium ADurb.Bin325]
MYTRMPSSAWTKSRYSPGCQATVRLQRAEKPSAAMPTAGEPVPQLKSMFRSLRVRVGLPARFRFDQYSAFQSGKVTAPSRSQRRRTRAPPVRS